jgi:hypothetical protein
MVPYELRPPTLDGWTMVVSTTPAWAFELTTTTPQCHDSNHYTMAVVPFIYTNFKNENNIHNSAMRSIEIHRLDVKKIKVGTSSSSNLQCKIIKSKSSYYMISIHRIHEISFYHLHPLNTTPLHFDPLIVIMAGAPASTHIHTLLKIHPKSQPLPLNTPSKK